jgi:hypothetical protein
MSSLLKCRFRGPASLICRMSDSRAVSIGARTNLTVTKPRAALPTVLHPSASPQARAVQGQLFTPTPPSNHIPPAFKRLLFKRSRTAIFLLVPASRFLLRLSLLTCYGTFTISRNSTGASALPFARLSFILFALESGIVGKDNCKGALTCL